MFPARIRPGVAPAAEAQPPRWREQESDVQPHRAAQSRAVAQQSGEARDPEGGCRGCSPVPGPPVHSGKVCHQGEHFFRMYLQFLQRLN